MCGEQIGWIWNCRLPMDGLGDRLGKICFLFSDYKGGEIRTHLDVSRAATLRIVG